MLPHGFLSMLLHIAVQFSIFHHPALLTTYILLESGKKSIAETGRGPRLPGKVYRH